MLKLLEIMFDLRMLVRFRADTGKLWEYQGDMYQDVYGVARQKQQGTLTVERRLTSVVSYQKIRSRINQSLLRVIDLARQNGVPVDIVSLPPANMKGTKRAVNIIQAIVNDEAYGGVNHRWILDAVDQITGTVRRQLHQAVVRLLNPGVWVLDSLTFVARLPLLLLLPAGINLPKLESSWTGKTVKLLGSIAWPSLAIYLYLLHTHRMGEFAMLLQKIKNLGQIIWPA